MNQRAPDSVRNLAAYARVVAMNPCPIDTVRGLLAEARAKDCRIDLFHDASQRSWGVLRIGSDPATDLKVPYAETAALMGAPGPHLRARKSEENGPT